MRRTILLSITVCLMGAMPSRAQLLDRLAEKMVDAVNTRVLKQAQVDPEIRAVQVSATKILLRGSATDWENFARNTEEMANALYRQEVYEYKEGFEESFRKTPTSTTCINVFGSEVAVEVPDFTPYNWQGGPPIKRKGEFMAISPISTGLGGGNTYFLVIKTAPANETEADRLWNHSCRADGADNAYGTYAAIITEDTRLINFEDSRYLLGTNSRLGFIADDIKKVKEIDTNVDWLFVRDFDADGIDEICVVTYVAVPTAGAIYYILVYRKVYAEQRYQRVADIILADYDSPHAILRVGPESMMIDARWARFQRGVLKPVVQ